MVCLRELTGILLLSIMSARDIKEQKIHIMWILVFAVFGCAMCYLVRKEAFFLSLGTSAWIAGCCFLASKVSRNGIGRGDIWLLSLLPVWKEGDDLILTFFLAFVCAAIYSLIRFGIRDRTRRFAFIPWISIGFAATAVWKLIRHAP